MNVAKPRILVVDDELGIREGCRMILELEGYEVDTAEDGMAALHIFQSHKNYSAALIDLKMPGIGGLELVEKLRVFDDDLVMFIITAYATIATAVEATKRGAYGYIPKPFTPDELLLPIKQALKNRELSIEAKRLREERENRLLEVAFERSKSSTIIKCMTDGVLVINRDKQIVLCNDAVRQIIPGCDDAPLPIPLSTLGNLDGLSTLLNEAVEVKTQPFIVSKEISIGKRIFMINVSPVMDPGSDSAGTIAVLRDITELKELEMAKSMFVSMVAHEVKRPLGVIEGYLNLILSGLAGKDPQEQKELLERSLVRAKTLRTLVAELMDLAAMETGKYDLKRIPLNIMKVIEEATDSCREKATEKGSQLTVNYTEGDDSDLIMADKEAMLIVFNNLIDNAIKYTPENGHIDIILEHTENYIKVSVKDDGIGLTPEDKEKLFEEFFRARNKYTAQIPGTGLGLSIVKRFVEMHHGKITVETSPGKGSTFTVWLPKGEH